MKCDNCIFQTGYSLGADEGGGYHVYCTKGHWEGGGNLIKGGTSIHPDPWENCKDFQEPPLHEAEEFKL